VMDRGFILDVCPNRAADGKSFAVELHFQMVPLQSNHNRTSLETFTVNAGAQVNLVMTANTDVDLPQVQVVDMHEHVNVSIGKYFLVGAVSTAIGDAKADPRQTLLFIRLDNAAQ